MLRYSPALAFVLPLFGRGRRQARRLSGKSGRKEQCMCGRRSLQRVRAPEWYFVRNYLGLDNRTGLEKLSAPRFDCDTLMTPSGGTSG